MAGELFSAIYNRIPALTLLLDEPLSRHTSFRIGGCCSAMAVPSSEGELVSLLELLREFGVTAFILGRGTNILATDGDIAQFFIKLGSDFSDFSLDGDCICATAGASLASIAVMAKNNSLAGFEFAHGIPGCLGGAIYMNAGAYGGEMRDVIVSVRYFDTKAGEIVEKSCDELDFSYRHSFFCDKSHIILSAVIRLTAGDKAEIEGKMLDFAGRRRASQPLDKPSGGSTFKRPSVGYAAAMIDDCGLKGYAIGGAMVSPKHAGFVVSDGTASFSDVMALMSHVSEVVLREKGVVLEPELRIIL